MTTTAKHNFLDKALDYAHCLSRFAIWAAGALTLISALYITINVLFRKLAGFSIGGSDELSGYAFAISITWALSFATLERANIRIDALYQVLPTRICAVLDWVSLVALAVFIVYISRYAAEVTQTSWVRQSTSNTTLGTPLWIPQLIWLVGLVWFCIVLALLLLRSTWALVTGDFATISRLARIRSTQEEAEEEAEEGRRMVEGSL